MTTLALSSLSSQRRILLGAAAIVVLASAAALFRRGGSVVADEERFALGGKVRRISGDRVKLKDGRDVEFAGIRLPYEHEPEAESSRRVLAAWLDDEGVRLEFDELREHRKDRLLAYVHANDTFINQRLARDGLAFVKLRAGNRRYADELLAAQSAARREGKGIWALLTPTAEGELLVDEAAATFHRADCEDTRGKPGLKTVVGSAAAFDQGSAPCGRCRPIETAGA